MKFSTRILTYLAVGLIIPIGIFIYERGYNADAMLWIIFIAVLATGYELILKFKKR